MLYVHWRGPHIFHVHPPFNESGYRPEFSLYMSISLQWNPILQKQVGHVNLCDMGYLSFTFF